MSWIGAIALLATIIITSLGAFSRFTHGRYTPAFYAYQVDRAPDDASTRLVPFVDATLCALLIFAETRAVAALLCAVFQFAGLCMRVRADKSAAADLAMCLAALLVVIDGLLS